MALNQNQREVAEQVMDFLLNPAEHAIIIDGPGGTGKSFLVNHIIDNLMGEAKDLTQIVGERFKYVTVYLTATTHKALTVYGYRPLAGCSTIHSLVGWKPYSSKRDVREDAPGALFPALVIIDECSMVDAHLFSYFERVLPNCKIIFVGDKLQLPPVNERISLVYAQGYRELSLTQNMRIAGSKSLLALVNDVREFAQTGTNPGISVDGADILHITEEQEMMDYLRANPQTTCIAYTNDRVKQIRTDFRSQVLNLPVHWVPEETIFVNRYKIPEFPAEVVSYNATTFTYDGTSYPVRSYILRALGQSIYHWEFESQRQYQNLVRKMRGRRDWSDLNSLEQKFGTSYNSTAMTAYKAQGASMDTVLVDLDNLSLPKERMTAIKMLYVGVSRARKQLVLLGDFTKG